MGFFEGIPDPSKKPATPIARPVNPEALLSHPVWDGYDQTRCYSGWDHHHGRKQRFFVAGWPWFVTVSGVNRPEAMLVHSKDAVKAVKQAGTWNRMVGQKNIWDDLGLPPLRAASERTKMFFQKSALVLLACELELEQQKANGTIEPGWEPLDVYNFMAIVPACWHINDLDEAALRGLTSGHRTALRNHTGQARKDFIDEMGKGCTYTWRTTFASHEYLSKNCPELGIGFVDAKPAAPLGTREAAEKERRELDQYVR